MKHPIFFSNASPTRPALGLAGCDHRPFLGLRVEEDQTLEVSD
jgi:hypothetical protein